MKIEAEEGLKLGLEDISKELDKKTDVNEHILKQKLAEVEERVLFESSEKMGKADKKIQ